MRLSRIAAAIPFAALTAFAIAAAPARATQPPPQPKPGPEHAILKMDEGTWDAIIEVVPGPGATPVTTKGVEVNTIGCGGLCLISDFKGEAMPGVPFHGHGVAAWDPGKKKYVGSWTDSLSQGIAVGESTWDPASKKMTGWMEGRDATGNLMKSRTVSETPQEGKRVMTMYAPGPDGKEMQMMRITYARRK